MKLRTITSSITGFSTSDKGLTVYFNKREVQGKVYYNEALAHPALQVKPHIGKAQELKIVETEQGWKMIQPYPTAEEIKAWEQAKAERNAVTVTEATAEQVALLTF